MTQNQEARPQQRDENNKYERPILIRVDYATGPDGEVLVPEAKGERKTLDEVL